MLRKNLFSTGKLKIKLYLIQYYYQEGAASSLVFLTHNMSAVQTYKLHVTILITRLIMRASLQYAHSYVQHSDVNQQTLRETYKCEKNLFINALPPLMRNKTKESR